MLTGDINPPCPFEIPVRALHADAFRTFCAVHLGVAPGRVERDLSAWLDEDHGAGDATVRAALAHAPEGRMFIVARHDFVLCGLQLMAQVFRLACGPDIALHSDIDEGGTVRKGQVVLAGRGPAAGFLLGERVALNLGARLSGIATKTRAVASALEAASPPGRAAPALLETRKTTPGLRLYEKYATRAGGARNHRHGLDSGAMLKENHLRAVGNLPAAVRALKSALPVLCKIEVEVTSLEEFHVALAEGADVIMLDNFSAADVAVAVAARDAHARDIKLEISGNLDTRDLGEIARCGVDFASMGALIHKADWVDMSLQFFK